MLGVIIAFFSLAAIFGMWLISFVLRNKNTPKGVALTHGAFAAIGLILLIIYSFVHYPRPIESLILFIIAASGGFILIYRDLTGKSLPKWLAIAHGSIAVLGFLFLLIYTFVR